MHPYLWVLIGLMVGISLLIKRFRTRFPLKAATTGTQRRRLRVTFLHPDLGIGGAERLILDACMALEKNHDVKIVTNFFDPARCLDDAKTRQDKIIVAGGFIPRHILGKGHVLFASIRMFIAAVWCAWSLCDSDIWVVDQVALAMLPLRLLTPRPVLFYCHFPDQLCDPTRMGSAEATASRSIIRKIYRSIFDWLEASMMHCASRIVCNSEFTLGITLDTFPSLQKSKEILPGFENREESVLNPPVSLQSLLNGNVGDDKVLKQLADQFTIVSINRYERKKNINLAIEAFATFKKKIEEESAGLHKALQFKPHLVHAGGYDERLPENREHFDELIALTKKLDVEGDVTFLRSISDDTKRQLLRQVAAALVYTPTNEHFGIVPVEAMACRVPVVAVNLGGPLESVGKDGSCGILTDPVPEKFAQAFATLYDSGSSKRNEMGEAGNARVTRLFTLESFTTKLEGIVRKMTK